MWVRKLGRIQSPEKSELCCFAAIQNIFQTREHSPPYPFMGVLNNAHLRGGTYLVKTLGLFVVEWLFCLAVFAFEKWARQKIRLASFLISLMRLYSSEHRVEAHYAVKCRGAINSNSCQRMVPKWENVQSSLQNQPTSLFFDICRPQSVIALDRSSVKYSVISMYVNVI